MGRAASTRLKAASVPRRKQPVVSPEAQNILQQLRALPSEEFAALEANLRPRRAAVSGFMAANDSLLEIVEADMRALAQLGLTPQEVGARLEQFLYPYLPQNYCRTPARGAAAIPNHCIIRFYEPYNGWQHCPFSDVGCGGTCPDNDGKRDAEFTRFAHGNFDIHNTRTGEKVKGPGLLAHLATFHNFFEGGIRYRVDPVALARVMELV